MSVYVSPPAIGFELRELFGHYLRMQAWIEGTVEQLYGEAGLDYRVGASPVKLARELLGVGSVVTVHASALPGDAELVLLQGKPRIYVRSLLSAQRRNFAVLHELAEWQLQREDYRGEDREDVADALAAALLAPRQRFLSVLRENGTRFPLLAQRFVSTESLVALRLGEATGEPIALIANRVRVRGQEWVWPCECELRRAASGRAPLGIRKARLKDARGRVVLMCSG